MQFLDMLSCFISIIPKLMYLLVNCFLTIIDIFQMFFRKLAGLDVYYVDGTATSGDIVYNFIKNIVTGGEYPMLTTAFWALIILGLILLFLSTLIAVIRSEYTTDKAENGKGKILMKSFKSLAYFAIVPICCLFGVYLANVVLRGIDSATSSSTSTSSVVMAEGKGDLLKPYTVEDASLDLDLSKPNYATQYSTYTAYNLFGIPVGTNSTTFSGVVFKAAAYECNRVRMTTDKVYEVNGVQYQGYFDLLDNDLITNFGGLFTTETGDADVLADYIDEAFAGCVQLNTGEKLLYDERVEEVYNNNLVAEPFAAAQQGITINVIDRYNVTLVWYFYNLWFFNWLIAYGAGIIIVVLFMNIILGLMKRLVELIGLFLISPPLVAMMPMDNGKMFEKWRDSFVSKTIMAYGAVGGMNIFFLILPYLNDINFFNIHLIDLIINTIIIIVGLVSIKGFIGLISGFIGAENAEEAGGKIAKDVGGAVAKAGMMTVAGARAGAMVAGAGVKGAYKIMKARDQAYEIKKQLKTPEGRKQLEEQARQRRIESQARKIDRNANEVANIEEKIRASAPSAVRASESAWQHYQHSDEYKQKYAAERQKRAEEIYEEKLASGDIKPISDREMKWAPTIDLIKPIGSAIANTTVAGGRSVKQGISNYFKSPIIKPTVKSFLNLTEMMYEPIKKHEGVGELKDFGKNLVSVGKGESGLDRIIENATIEQKNSLSNQREARKRLGLNADF